jgi:hypothetical protein
MAIRLQPASPVTKPRRGPRKRPAAIKIHSSVFTRYVGTLKIPPAEQYQLSLGFFGTDRPEKGFCVEFSPDPNPVDSVVTELFSIGSPTRYELFLCLANFSDRAVTAEVWQM